MNPIISTVLLILIVIVAWGFVLNVGLPAIEGTKTTLSLSDAEKSMKILGNYIVEVASEGVGATRVFKSTGGEFNAIPEEDSIEFRAETNGIDYFSRVVSGNIMRISGSDVNCYEEDIDNDGVNELILENSFLKIGFQKVSKTSPYQQINTEKNIVFMEEKTKNTVILPVNSSIVINDVESTSLGNGYSEILKSGFNKPLCTVHVFVNSTASYDVYYTLYAGADFVVIDVKV